MTFHGLLIPIPRSKLEALVKALRRVAPFDWDSRGAIHVFPLEEDTHANVADVLCEYCQNNKIQYVLVPKRVHCNEKAIAEAGYTVVMGPTIVELVHGDVGDHLKTQFSGRKPASNIIGAEGAIIRPIIRMAERSILSSKAGGEGTLPLKRQGSGFGNLCQVKPN